MLFCFESNPVSLQVPCALLLVAFANDILLLIISRRSFEI